jgi:serine/threonine protein kinase
MIYPSTILEPPRSNTMQYPSSGTENPVPNGTILDNRYQVLDMIGEGGLGRTYLATDSKRFDREYVIKEFCPRKVSDAVLPKAIELFEREAKTLDRLSHPQIPKFYGWFLEGDRWFFIQDYIQGLTYANILRQRQQDGQVFDELEVIQWLKDLLPVLEYIHEQGVIHRDISPDNIMQPSNQQSGQRSEPQSQPLSMLIDFGVAKVFEADRDVLPGARRFQGTAVGKSAFSAPEQIKDGKCSVSSDLYSLALSALKLLTGKDRWDLFNTETKTWKWDTPVLLSNPFIQILSKLLREQPQDRYQSATDVLNDLKAMGHSGGGTHVNGGGTRVSLKLNPKALVMRGLLGLVCIIVFGTIVGIWTPRIPELCRLLNNCPRPSDLFVPQSK